MSKQNPWLLARFPDYYDVNTGAVARHSQELGQLRGQGQRQALEQIRDGVLGHAERWDHTILTRAAISMTDDLYKFGCTTQSWDETAAAYVTAVWGSFLPHLAQRGFQVRYVVENTWPHGLQRPLQLFPALFIGAGVAYVCPHSLAAGLPEAAGSDASITGLAAGVAEGRLLAAATVRTLEHRRARTSYTSKRTLKRGRSTSSEDCLSARAHSMSSELNRASPARGSRSP